MPTVDGLQVCIIKFPINHWFRSTDWRWNGLSDEVIRRQKYRDS